MKFHTLLSALKRILSLLKSGKLSESCSDTPQSLKPSESVAVCIGHSRKGDEGAVNVKGVSEWKFNSKVGYALVKELKKKGINSKAYGFYKGNSYREAMAFLKDNLKQDGHDLAIELHFNAYTGRAKGCSMLYDAQNEQSKDLAIELQRSVLEDFDTIDRDIKPISKGERGWLFVSNDNIPTVLCEPFFGDNKEDYALFSDVSKLATSYANAIENFLVGKANK